MFAKNKLSMEEAQGLLIKILAELERIKGLGLDDLEEELRMRS